MASQDNRKKWSRMFGVESQEIDFFSWFGPRTQDPGPRTQDLPLVVVKQNLSVIGLLFAHIYLNADFIYTIGECGAL